MSSRSRISKSARVAAPAPSSAPALTWSGPGEPRPDPTALRAALEDLGTPMVLVRLEGELCVVTEGDLHLRPDEDSSGFPVAGVAPPAPIGGLGDPTFQQDHGLRFPYVAGAMANGIGSVAVVEAMGRGGMLGFFGAAGLSPERVERAIDEIENAGGGREFPFGFNLIHSPTEPHLESEIVDLYIRRGITRVEASAFLDLTLPLVRYRVHGIHEDADGHVRTPNQVIGKVSRVEVATKFFSPPPDRFLDELVRSGDITAEQARLAARIPVARDLTAEADSGGHTDNRPAVSLLPTLLDLRDRLQGVYGFDTPLRVGAAGGIATPASTAAAFAMGAAYVLTGSINQGCVEAGTSEIVRGMLADAEQADIAMAPAADMFEMGVKVQVLKRGTMFAMRAGKLHELYRSHDSLEALPPATRASLEKGYFGMSLDQVWGQCVEYFQERDPAQIEKAARDPHHRMALVFRWYLGQSSHWANHGESTRKVDYQIWCGPAMPAFNEWARGSFLENPEERRVETLALNLLHGAALLTRAHTLRCQGVTLPEGVVDMRPRRLEELKKKSAVVRGM